MKGKATSLVLIGGALIVGILTQDGSLNTIAGSRALTALITIAWFGIMGAGLYFWAKHTSQQTPRQITNPIRADENASLQQLAQAVGPKQPLSIAENAAIEEATQKSAR